jgi:hypothetical protein
MGDISAVLAITWEIVAFRFVKPIKGHLQFTQGQDPVTIAFSISKKTY